LNPDMCKRFSLRHNSPDNFWNPPIFLLNYYQGFFLEVKRLGVKLVTGLP